MALDRDVVLFGVIKQLLAGQQVPLTPGSYHFHTRLERIGTQLETHLIVTLAGGTMGDGISTGFVGDLDQSLGDQRTGNGSAQQVFAFIDSIGAEHREHEVTDELFTQILNVDLLHAHGLRLGTRRLNLLTLPQIRSEGHHLTTVGVFQPLENYRGIQTAGIGQDDFLNISHYALPR